MLQQAANASEFSSCVPFLDNLCTSSSSFVHNVAVVLNTLFDHLLAFAAGPPTPVLLRRGNEPIVKYVHESERSRVKPGEISMPGIFAGKLLCGWAPPRLESTIASVALRDAYA